MLDTPAGTTNEYEPGEANDVVAVTCADAPVTPGPRTHAATPTAGAHRRHNIHAIANLRSILTCPVRAANPRRPETRADSQPSTTSCSARQLLSHSQPASHTDGANATQSAHRHHSAPPAACIASDELRQRGPLDPSLLDSASQAVVQPMRCAPEHKHGPGIGGRALLLRRRAAVCPGRRWSCGSASTLPQNETRTGSQSLSPALACSIGAR